MYHVAPITDSNKWHAFISNHALSVFVQSPQYGTFYESLGESSYILGLYQHDTLIGGSLIVTTHAKRGTFLYLPYGPVLPWHDHDAVQVFFDYLKEFATEKQVDFVRLSPMAKNTPENLAVLKSHGYRAAPMHVLAENSWLLDLTDSEDELMRNMKKNHRNLIRRCIKEGVIVTKEGKAGLSHVHDLLDETAKRLNFHRFSRTYIDQEFDAFAPDHVETFVARLPDGRVDAAAVIMFYGTMAVYRHSGSLGLDRKVPTSYLIQWEVIKEAKKRDMSWYNFWGVEPKDASKNHPFAGIGHFKRGFGGEQFDLIHCHDLPITPKYWFNYTVEMIRKWKRGF